jgi:Bacterial membrane protein YfhO
MNEESRSSNEEGPRRQFFIRNSNLFILLALTAVLFLDVLFLGRGFYKGDLFPYHYPMKSLVRELGPVAQWNPAYHAGQPLAANPAYEVFYPPQWLIFAGTMPFAFQLHILVHIALAAIGMYLLLRDLELSDAAALFGAVTFAFGAPYLSLLIRLPFLFAMTWVPLVLMFARRAILHGRLRDIALGAIAFGMQALIGEPTTVLQTGALAASYVVYKRRPRALVPLAMMFAIGLVIAAVQLVPAIDHARDSIRAEGFDYRTAASWSTPPKRLMEVAYPQLYRALRTNGEQASRWMYDGRIEPYISDIYGGLFIVALGIAGVTRGVRGRWYVLAIVAAAALLAIGSHGPVFQRLFDWRLLPSIRYPEKFLLSALFALLVFGAVVLDAIAKDARLRRIATYAVVAWLIVGFFIWIGGSGGGNMPALAEARAIPWQAYWGMNVLRAAAVIALIVMSARGGAKWIGALIVFAVLDNAFMHWGQAARISRDYYASPKAASLLKPDGRLFHQAAWDEAFGDALAYSHFANAKQTNLVLRESMFPFLPAAFGFRMALEDDLDQTALLTSTELSRATIDVRRRTGAWHPFFLRAAGVRYVAQWLAVGSDPSIHIRDLGPTPRYWFAKRIRAGNDRTTVAQEIVLTGAEPDDAFVATPFAPAAGRVLQVAEHPSHVTVDVESDGQALLIASITRHKYWTATIDGARAAIVPANLAFQGIVVPQGKHRVELRYRNPLILPAGIASVLALCLCVAAAALGRRT